MVGTGSHRLKVGLKFRWQYAVAQSPAFEVRSVGMQAPCWWRDSRVHTIGTGNHDNLIMVEPLFGDAQISDDGSSRLALAAFDDAT